MWKPKGMAGWFTIATIAFVLALLVVIGDARESAREEAKSRRRR